jgi:hypothetical protein
MSQEAEAVVPPQSSEARPPRQSGRLCNTSRMDNAVAAEALDEFGEPVSRPAPQRKRKRQSHQSMAGHESDADDGDFVGSSGESESDSDGELPILNDEVWCLSLSLYLFLCL